MASTIILSDNGVSSGSAGLKSTAGNDGVLILQTTTSGGTATNALTIDTAQGVSVGTSTANTIAGNSNAKYFAVQGDGTLSSADGRIVLSNPRAYASISAGSTTAGRVFFQLTNASGGTTAEAASIDALASGSGGASGYGIDIRFLPKGDNASSGEAARINYGGNFILKGGTGNANGTGITFPATQSASTDANCLDDYEEGTFSPGAYPSTGSFTTVTQSGSYIKIGKQVTCFVTIEITAVGTGSGLINFSMPFTSRVQRAVANGREGNSTGNTINGTSTVGSSLMTIWMYNNTGTAFNGYGYNLVINMLTD